MDIRNINELETENARLRAQLAAAEARSTGLIEQSLFSVQLLEPDGRTRYVNPAWERLWGLNLEILETMGYNTLTDPQLEAQGIAPYIRRGFAGEACAIPVILYDPAAVGLPGTPRYVAGHIYPIKNAEGVITEVVLVHQDVTDQKLAEASLAETNAQLVAVNRDIEAEVVRRTQELHQEQGFIRAMLDTLNEGIVACNAEGVLTVFNRASQAILGLTDLTVPAAEWARAYALYHPDGVTPLAMHEVPLYRALQGEVIEDVEVVVCPAGQPPRHLLTSGRLITDAQGRKLGAMVAMYDVTALQAAIAELREADRYKDEFLSVISHELRTPLNFITGFASILLDGVSGALNPAQQRHVEKILNGSDRMLSLVNDLLDFAKIASGKFELHPEPQPYGSLVDEALALLQPLAEQKRLVLGCDVDLGDRRPRLDGPRVTQVLTNLVSNAIKFTEPGGQVTVRASVRDGRLVTEVVDTGVGIQSDDIPRLFTRFQQLEMGNTRSVGGTGLGLAIAKALVEAHGGTIGVKSEPGVGSTFWFELPLEV